MKTYIFASQFVNNKDIFDAGCGSGYGVKYLKDKGAHTVKGVDLSKHSIKYAKQRFGKDVGEDAFSVQNILKLTFEDDSFDVTICSEVLEHIKEYQKEEAGLQEMIRITKNKGILIIGVPNREHLRNHGFYFEQLSELLKRNFESFVIFENALLPFERYGIESWQERLKNGKTGVVVTQSINFSYVILPENLNGINDLNDLIKKGIPSGYYKLGHISINTNLLHNTYSFLAVITNKKEEK